MKELKTEIAIAAAPQRVWAVLTNFAGYREWNPFVTALKGNLKPGERLEAQFTMAGRKPTVFKPVVTRVEPLREFRWRGALPIPGLFSGEHYFRLEADGAGTRLSHGEIFRGLIPGLMSKKFWDNTRAGFEAMNAALKVRAEKS